MEGERKPEKIQTRPSREGTQEMMRETDIISFLEQHGVETLKGWQPGEPLLYVLEDVLRSDIGPYQRLPRRLRPSIARLDSPTDLDPGYPALDKDGSWTRMLGVVNETGGQVYYYAIDPETKAITLVKSSSPKRGYGNPYMARETLLFRTKDSLFPRAQNPA